VKESANMTAAMPDKTKNASRYANVVACPITVR
jgi:hypothetical protein